MRNEVFYKVEKIEGDEQGDWRAVGETANSGGLIHIVVYGANSHDAFTKLLRPMHTLSGSHPLTWTETDAPIPY